MVIDAGGVVMWIDSNGGVRTITTKFIGKEVSISSAGNVLVLYCEETKEQLVYKFEDESYRRYDISIAQIKTADIVYDYYYDYPSRNSAIADENSVGSYIDAMQKAASGFYNEYPNGLCGVSVIGCAYELEEGSEIWSTSFIVADITKIHGYTIPSIDKRVPAVIVYGARKVQLKLTLDNYRTASVNKINIYASRPIVPYNIEYGAASNHTISEMSLEELGLDGQLMYYQGSVMANKESITYTLDYRTEKFGEDIMNVSSGCIERVGRSIAYNNRFHYFRSDVQHVIQSPTVSHETGQTSSISSWIAYVKFDEGWKLINRSYVFAEDKANNFIYPMIGVKQMAFVRADNIMSGDEVTGISVPYTDMFYVDLKDSSAYNYSYAFDVTPQIVLVGSFYDIISDAGQIYAEDFEYDTKVFWDKESNEINVSAQYNPFVFPVNYSYSFSGEILDIATSYLPISSTQIGQYPLSIFTSNGIFALEQGDGSVLYSNITPLQPYVIEGKTASTPYGTFFISSKSLYLLSGREVANVSNIMNGNREITLRDHRTYRTLCCNNAEPFYNFLEYLSREDFEDFITSADLIYDQLRNELYISKDSADIPYSYVFGLDTKSYHKINNKYVKPQSGARYAIEIDGDTRNMVDFYSEDDIASPVLLQSRPMSLEALYTHIQRLILLVDTKLEGKDQHLCLSVFGSDDLYNWRCIISSQKQKTVLRQVRTNRSAKSYKDYVFLITGILDANTNISDLILDYTVVSRRLG